MLSTISESFFKTKNTLKLKVNLKSHSDANLHSTELSKRNCIFSPTRKASIKDAHSIPTNIFHTIIPTKNSSNQSESLNFLNLPAEIQADIAMLSGFFGAIAMRGTCKKLFELLNNRRSWYSYTRSRILKQKSMEILSSVDEIVNTVTIVTKIHTFDHLIFGEWKKSLDSEENPTIFFEHRAFSDKYGGLKINLSKGGLINDSDFFDHRESLPCYVEYVKNQMSEVETENGFFQEQVVPSTIGGIRVDHSCEKCEGYDLKEPFNSIFIFDQIPSNLNWKNDGFTYVHEFKDKSRKLVFNVIPYKNTAGFTNLEELPWVTVNSIRINDRKLNSHQFELFKRLANGA
ncbi:hypothetical protein HK099_006004 [Clydaea vesicula]|uniref:Uncharacterized protein n=1 Tax=Clydaea vesicula TaxID=447962 RepID=A0AAD5U0D5_9FUNG|nr:hypothetical protein HK099_006004 [Clydaea vesicula]